MSPSSTDRLPMRSERLTGNWKQHAWNYMDNYHIRFVHKGPGGLADAIDLETYTTELHQYSALQWAYARRPKEGFAPEQVVTRFKDPNDGDKRVFALWWFIFPNTTLNFYPWAFLLTSICRCREDLIGPGFTGSNIHWTKRSSTKETRSGSTNKSTLRI